MSTALITGASSGIGKALAQQLAAKGYDVVLVARSEQKLKDLAAALERKYEIQAHVLIKDLAVPHAAADMVRQLEEKQIAVDILVNNAGFGLAGQFLKTDEQRELNMIQLNITALTQLTKRLLPHMVEQGSGSVLNVASTAAFQPGPGMAVYFATKAYVLWFSEALTEELSGTGVHVTTLCPGPTATGFASQASTQQMKMFQNTGPSAEEVARQALAGLFARKAIVIPGIKNKFLVFLNRIAPRAVVRKIVKRMM